MAPAHPPALLHTHGYKAGLIGRLSRAQGLPVVSTFHAGERRPIRGPLQRLDEWTSSLAQRIAVSAPIAKKLPFRSTLIPNFIRIPEPVCAAASRAACCLCRAAQPEKAPDRFCAMAWMLQDRAHFHIYGDGPMRTGLETEFSGCVTFHGFRADMQSVWPEIDLLVIPSRAEGLPMAALEAIARGIPLIATDVGALSTVIGDGEAGWLLPGDTDERGRCGGVAALGQWLSFDQAARGDLSARARERAIRHFGEGPALRRSAPSMLARAAVIDQSRGSIASRVQSSAGEWVSTWRIVASTISMAGRRPRSRSEPALPSAIRARCSGILRTRVDAIGGMKSRSPGASCSGTVS